ncbi:N-acetylmuramoyl-L-alanine amidase [Bacillus sp. FJAT-29814]|uniref:N-acetylmuramoyl-L-alanine amidase n=1 Tax=Bacillus sp. FJAT-29814 TaxID=1729688 RepID=UPI0020A45144|nr:N-acetylmuramoyl-L-alanine amidase [Bacillus sp. FJAT-29814]
MWDPGHGGIDPGAVANGLQESKLTLKIVQYAMTYLESYYMGFEQRATRLSETTVELSRRDDPANAWPADVFVSVHINAGGGTGFESFVYNGAGSSSVALQNILHAEILAAMRQYGSIPDRGKKRANFAVLRATNMPAILTENLFIDSNDANRLKDETFIKAIGEAHARGVAKFLGLAVRPQTLAISSPSVVYEAHVQELGWQGPRRDGQTAGTIGQSRRIEALTVRLEHSDARLTVEGHIESLGWTPARTNGEVVGTIGKGLRLEAIKINCDKHSISYRVHVQNIGWTAWIRNGEIAGTTGQGLRIEAIEIKLA